MKLSRSSTSPNNLELPHDVTPETRQVLAGLLKAGKTPMFCMPPSNARAFYEQAASILELPNQPGLEVTMKSIIARDQCQIAVRMYAPIEPESIPPVSTTVGPLKGALLYFHGGGFTVGSLDTHDGLCRRLCLASQQIVLSIDYRLAPEYPFPQAVHDCVDATQFVMEHGAEWGLDSNRIMVAGDSAGGTLASVVALHARDQGWLLRGQLLIYPGTTAYQETDSHRVFAKGYVLENEHIRYFFSHYIPDLKQRQDWRFAPSLAPDHSGLPPTWMVLAECDPLRDDGLLYAELLRGAGVPVDVQVYSGVVHGFIQWSRMIPQANQATAYLAEAMRMHLSSA